ncbi:OmpA/MotB family protein [Thiocystis violacea]|uniref:OmpA/MotB family protein n=1 Tax=Thiocystis violacea TaxID=13725 RepID=UPI00190457A6|nr:OmpA family protein [Thiocystis violacea]MBK1724260.1 cell envelope biogenesis protein OmpA [Thiocystis violacea]
MSNASDRTFGRSTGARDSGEHWLSVSDLMAGLMMVFLFVSIALMRDAMIERDKIREVAVAYQENQVELYQALVDEFKNDLKEWDAEIEKETLSFQFKSPDVLFDTGKISLKPAFQDILKDFFPRYLSVLMLFRDSIDEVRIEGHTSSVWNHQTTKDEAYFNNMELSQGRTRSVLLYVFGLPGIAFERSWVREHVAAVGFSSSRLVKNDDGSEDLERSRRVSFRVITNAETQIRKILEN